MTDPKDLALEIESLICDWNAPSQLAASIEGTCRRIASWHISAQQKLLSELVESGVFVTYKADNGHGIAIPIETINKYREELG